MNPQERGRQTFLEEAQELLADLEQGLLAWETRLDDPELINRIFRAMHTIKGSSAMFGFDRVAEFTHGVESVLDRVRSGRLGADRDLVELTLRARDEIAVMLQPDAGTTERAEVRILREAFARLVVDAGDTAQSARPHAAGSAVQLGSQPVPPPAESGVSVIYRIQFKPSPDLLLRGVDLISLLKELRALGKARIVARTTDIPPLAEIIPEHCYLAWDIRLTTRSGLNAIKDVFIFVEDDCELRIESLGPAPVSSEAASLREPGEAPALPAERMPPPSTPPPPEVSDPGRHAPPVQAADAGAASATTIGAQPAQDSATHSAPLQSSVRVPSERLDALMDLVGELVSVQARLSQTAASQGDPGLSVLAEEVERLTAELRESAMTIRMVPIGTLFSRFHRLVRDLARELERDVEMVLRGEQTELDKTVIERLNNPLVHLIRNSLDHGIEPPAVRRAAGKPERGRLEISAEHSGATVLIRIRDDGAGIDVERIRAKAVERGLIAADAVLSEQEVQALIFAPGFSTAEAVTDVSGRGVGLDVVKRSIDTLRGHLRVTSRPGQGAEFEIQLPLTLAIIDGLLVAVGDQRYIVPLSLVEECVALNPDDRIASAGRSTVTVREEMVPFVSLRNRFGINGSVPGVEQVVIGSVQGERFGLVVDRVVGNHQTVIKPLSKVFHNVTDLSGATILGDGAVALIVDLARIHKSTLAGDGVRVHPAA